MLDQPITVPFNDGAAYEQSMGKWSQLAGCVFLDWLMPTAGMRWLDVGCGNGAFTELIIKGCAPSVVEGIDPSEGQLAYALHRPGAAMARFSLGNAMQLPHDDQTFDSAVMALVIVFVPDPEKGVAEMVRVVKPGGLVATYVWDMTRDGFPLNAVWEEMRAAGIKPASPPRIEASRIENLKALWAGAGLEGIETKEIAVQRTFPSFEKYWQVGLGANAMAQIATLDTADQGILKNRIQARLPEDAAGRVTFSARANAIKGRRPS